MYLFLGSGSHGHGTSFCPGFSGAPTECMQGMNVPFVPSLSITAWPMRVMIRMLTTTYGESLNSMPTLQIGDSSGPMANGTTYIVRPFMQPLNKPTIFCFISAGSAQLFVGPASSFVLEQMYVRSSTRATSLGCDRARKLPGRFFSFNFVNVPLSTIDSHSASYSSSEPSHQKTSRGWQRLTISSTHVCRA